MKILIISGSPIMGGAEQASRRLAKGLAKSGCQVVYAGIYPEELKEPGICQYILDPGPIYGIFLRYLRYCSYPLSYIFNTRFVIRTIEQIIRIENPDVINIHVIKQAFWSPDLVDFCANQRPLVWTLHEMSSFTGRCTQALSCTKFILGCDDSCPSLHIPIVIPRSLTQSRWRHQKKVIENHKNIVGVCPSYWLANQAKASLWANNRVEIISNGIDLQEFRPFPRCEVRKLLGLPSGIRLILIAAVDLNSPSKGGSLLMDALTRIKVKNFGVVMMGRGELSVDNCLHIPIFNLGFVPPSMTPMVYSAVDLLVHPSLAESFGLVVIEANACGTPVLAFKNTALQEIIKDGVNGWLVRNISVEALAECIDFIMNSNLLSDFIIKQNCREESVKYGLERYAETYKRVFSSLIEK